uniref:Uncharacterized protein n=1 Tax=Myotis myotis TaxID=51298 RepID=A0A7J7UQ32_MYOMY|nr:hypothetical protein mMyoMyo1_008638 [Myotis myotis]
MGIEQLESRDPERWVRVIVGIKLPLGLPASGPHAPPPPPPHLLLPAEALPLLQRTPPSPPGCARVLFVTVRQKRIIRIMASRPEATISLPGPRAPLAPGQLRATYARDSRGSSCRKTQSKRRQTRGGRGQGAAW